MLCDPEHSLCDGLIVSKEKYICLVAFAFIYLCLSIYRIYCFICTQADFQSIRFWWIACGFIRSFVCLSLCSILPPSDMRFLYKTVKLLLHLPILGSSKFSRK